MKKLSIVSKIQKNNPLNKIWLQNKVTIGYTLETANSTLNVDSLRGRSMLIDG